MFLTIAILLFGLSLGSFSNVCIYRIPLNLSIVSPRRSYCPWCNHAIAWYRNIPLVTYLVQHARCASCRSRISPRYPIVELLLPTLWIFFAVTLSSISFSDVIFIGFVLFFAIVVSFIDIDWRIIPDCLSLTWAGSTLFVAPLNPIFRGFYWIDSYTQSFIGSMSAVLIIWVASLIGKSLKNRDVMGWGDLKLMAFWGALLGFPDGAIVFFAAAFLGTLWVIASMLKNKLRSSDFLPFGPFINIAGVCLFWWNLSMTK